jgi:hypothetical protein
MSEEKATSQFIETLKSQYDKEFDSAGNLDNKGNNMTAAAGTVAGLLFGFGTFLISNISPTYVFIYYAISLLIVGISGNIVTVLFCIYASRAQRYDFTMKHEIFFKKEQGQYERIKEEEGILDEDTINAYKNASLNEFQDRIIRDYLGSNKFNHELNEKKGRMVYYAQIIFLGSLIIFPVLVVLVLHAFLTNAITVK